MLKCVSCHSHRPSGSANFLSEIPNRGAKTRSRPERESGVQLLVVTNRAIGRRTARTRYIWGEAITSVLGYLGVDRVLTEVEAVDPGEVAHDDHDMERASRERTYLCEIQGNLDVDLRDEHI